ncbi:8-amino-7-oxononanoate synthase [Camellia lanceoleosa]|uniref:8-amino-7-oxononanoate synthase n=1 Tax=Camellia lanceoleosa TaxID=1840588 RepID=A0ACC0G3U4_9ERIC|nr:8-amino-7-oxononanoate synthase [Camellia lanceoleosa]
MKNASNYNKFEVFNGLRQWDRASVEVVIADSTFQRWKFRKLLLFSGNDYLGLSSHPTVSKATAKAALAHRMGLRGSALICGYTSYHGLIESCLADLKKKEKKDWNLWIDAGKNVMRRENIEAAMRRVTDGGDDDREG